MPSSGCKKCALRSEEHTSELQSHDNLVCRLLLEKQERPQGAPAHASPSARLHRGRPPPSRAGGPDPPVGREAGRDAAVGGVDGVPLFFFNERPPPDACPLPLPGALRI